MNRTQHRAFAISRGVSPEIYDKMNADHEAKNRLIRTERAAYLEKLYDFGAGLGPHPGDLKFSFESGKT